MITPHRKRELLELAETYATRLHGLEVTRAQLRYVLDGLYLGPKPSLETASRLIKALPPSWVGGRTGRTRSQLEAVQRFFEEVQAKKLPAEDLRFLVGWTVRAVHVKNKEAEAAQEAAEKQGKG